MVHPECASNIDRIGRCPGACAHNPITDRTKCPSLQAFLLGIIVDALNGGPPLLQDDLKDLADEEMFWVLRCIYANGIGVPHDVAQELKWRKKAVYQDDPCAQMYLGTIKQDLTWVRLAAEAGHPKAILAMANYYRGNRILGHCRSPDLVEANKFITRGVDPVCLCFQAIESAILGGSTAEAKLRRARRENYSTDDLYGKTTSELASIYYDRNELVAALALAATIDSPTPDVYVSAGVVLSAIEHYDGDAKHDALECFLAANTPDAFVCIAKLMQAGAVPGGPMAIEKLMGRAAEKGHPDAGFYFLQDPECRDVPRYIAMMQLARDKGFLIRCAVYFMQHGKPELAEECKRIRLSLH